MKCMKIQHFILPCVRSSDKENKNGRFYRKKIIKDVRLVSTNEGLEQAIEKILLP